MFAHLCSPVSAVNHGSRCARAGHTGWLSECFLLHRPQWVHHVPSLPLPDPSSAPTSASSTNHKHHTQLTQQHQHLAIDFTVMPSSAYRLLMDLTLNKNFTCLLPKNKTYYTGKKTAMIWSFLEDGWRQTAKTGSTVGTGHSKVESWNAKEKQKWRYM